MQLLKKDGVNTQIITKGYFVGLTTLDYVFYVESQPQENAKTKTNHYKRFYIEVRLRIIHYQVVISIFKLVIDLVMWSLTQF